MEHLQQAQLTNTQIRIRSRELEDENLQCFQPSNHVLEIMHKAGVQNGVINYRAKAVLTEYPISILFIDPFNTYISSIGTVHRVDSGPRTLDHLLCLIPIGIKYLKLSLSFSVCS